MTCKRSSTDSFDAGFSACLEVLDYEIDQRLKGPERCHEECEYMHALVELSNIIHEMRLQDE